MEGGLVQIKQRCLATGESLFHDLVDHFYGNNFGYFHHSAEHYHVGGTGIAQFQCDIVCRYFVNIDIGTGGLLFYQRSVHEQISAGYSEADTLLKGVTTHQAGCPQGHIAAGPLWQ